MHCRSNIFHLSFEGRSSAPFSGTICHYLYLIENLGGKSLHLLCLCLNGYSSMISITWKTVQCQVNMAWLMWQSQDQVLVLDSITMNRNIWQELLLWIYVDEMDNIFFLPSDTRPQRILLFNHLIWLCIICFMSATIMDKDQICRF